LPVTAHRLAFADIDERHLMALRHRLDRDQPALELRTDRHAAVIDHHGDVVRLVQADAARGILVGNQLHGFAHVSLRVSPVVVLKWFRSDSFVGVGYIHRLPIDQPPFPCAPLVG
jgi:hypothetical protein